MSSHYMTRINLGHLYAFDKKIEHTYNKLVI